jgi:hypothetical protein
VCPSSHKLYVTASTKASGTTAGQEGQMATLIVVTAVAMSAFVIWLMLPELVER